MLMHEKICVIPIFSILKSITESLELFYINVQKSACLVINPSMVYVNSVLCNCVVVGVASNSMTLLI